MLLMESHSATTLARAWAVGRPKKACGQCKTQKVRCSGERPICKRCLRVGHECVYGSRRTATTPKAKRSDGLLSSSSARQGHEALHGGLGEAKIAEFVDQCPTPLLRSPAAVCYTGIPSDLIFELIDVYFANVYNATLLLHKSTFMQDVASGKARSHVILSVCAWAANFYRDAHGQTTIRDQGFMMEWAERAGKLVFSEVEEPHEDNIVTFMNLALLFYASGLWRRSLIHKGNAALLAQVLGMAYDRPEKEDLWVSEMCRRRFWACYLMNTHSSEPASTAMAEQSEAIMKLNLPWTEEEFESRSASRPRISLSSGESNGGQFCELIRIMTIWSAVNTLLRAPPKSMSSRLNAINEMHQRISVWKEKLPATLCLTPSHVPGILPEVLPKLLLIHTVGLQSLMALHASIVPIFSWSPGDSTWLPARQTSAQVAYEHACAASDLFRSVLDSFSPLSALPSFIAYAAYCSSAIQIPFMWSPEPSIRQKTRDNVRVNVRVVKVLSRYWKFATLYEKYLRYLYKVHAESSTLLENEPRSINPAKLTGGRFSAPDANTTILGFNRILWMKCGAPARNGEEQTELDGTEQKVVGQNDQLPAMQETPLFTKDHVEIFPSEVELQNPASLSFAGTSPALDVSTVPPIQIHTEQLSAPVYDADFDSFYPCEAEMVQLEAAFFDQMQPVMGLGSMGMFASWDSLGNSETGGNPYRWS